MRVHTHRPAWIAAAAALLATSIVASAQTLRWAAKQDLLTLDPHSGIVIFTNMTLAQVYEGLVGRDKDLNFTPLLATEWMQVNPLLWRVKLRTGVKFHDGSPFTADDVVFSIKRAQQPTANQRNFAMPLGEPRKVDDFTVEFVLPEPIPIFLVNATQIFIMSKTWAEKNNASVTPDFAAKEVQFTTSNTNGTGPYMLASRQPDVKTTFKRNPNWWGKFDGNVQEVVFTPMASDATRMSALLSGEIDFVHDPAQQDLPRLRTTPGFKVQDGMANWIYYVGMDQDRDELLYSNVKGKNPFKDARVRRALYHAVDAETLSAKVLGGQAFPTGSITYSRQASFNDPELERRLPFDLAKARTLLAEAGYPQGFEITLDCSNILEPTCVALATMWSRIGVKVKPNVQPVAIVAPKLQKLDTSLYLGVYGGGSTDVEPLLRTMLRSRAGGGVGFNNFGNFKNPKLEELAIASYKEADPAKREQLIRAILREHNEQVHHIPLYRPGFPWAMRSNVTAVHRADTRLEWQWITVDAKP